MGPLSRKARVKQWKSNGKNAVSMCDHWSRSTEIKPWKKRAKPFIRCNGRDCGRCICVSVRHTEIIEG